MGRNLSSFGLIQIGAVVAIVLFASYVGCSNPAAENDNPPPPDTDTKVLLHELIGCNIDSNANGIYIVGNFEGIIPFPGGKLPSGAQDALSADANQLDLNEVPVGESIPLTYPNGDTFAVANQGDGTYLFVLPGNHPYVTRQIDGMWLIIPGHTFVLITKISLSLDNTTLTGKFPFNAVPVTVTIEPPDATYKSLTWSSSDDTVIQAVNGVITPLKTSLKDTPVIITARAKDGSAAEDSLAVTVVSNDCSLGGLKVGDGDAVVSGNNFTISLGSSITSADVTFVMGENATAEYKFTGAVYTPIADSSFKVTGLQQGANEISIVVTAQNGDKETYLLTINVKDIILVTGISLSLSSPTLTAGGASGSVTATVLPGSADSSLAWTAAPSGLVTLDINSDTSKATITPLANVRGKVTITASAKDGSNIKGQAEVTVQSGDYSINGLKVNGNPVSGTSSPYTYSGTEASDTITFTLPAGASATYKLGTGTATSIQGASFTVNAPAPGNNSTITITVTAENGDSKDYTLTITSTFIQVTGITLSPASLTLTAGGAPGPSTTIKATVSPANATNPTLDWSSDNLSVATVDANGVVTPLSSGTANITAKAKDSSGISSAAAKVTVQSGDAGFTVLNVGTTPVSGTSPNFSATVENDVTQVNVSYTIAAGASATYKLGAGTATPIVGSPFPVSNLAVGNNIITITVKAENGTTATYTLTIMRKGSGQITLQWGSPGVQFDTVAGTVALGKSVTISITPPGSGTYTYQWVVDGNPVAGTNSNTYTFTSNGNDLGKIYNIALGVYQGANLITGDSIAITVTAN